MGRSDCVTERGATQLGSSLGFPAYQFVCSAWKAPNRLDFLSAIFLTSYLGVLEAEKLDSCHLGGETVATRLLVVGSLYRVTVSARSCFIELCGFLFCPTEHSVKRNSDALREDDCTWMVPVTSP